MMQATAGIAFIISMFDECEFFCACICMPRKIHLASPPSAIRAASASISASKSMDVTCKTGWQSWEEQRLPKEVATKCNKLNFNSFDWTMSLTESLLSLFFSPAAGFLPFFLACAERNKCICSGEHLEVPLYMQINGICTCMLTNADIYSSLATS